MRGTVYPDGPWGPDSHIQWGAILYDWLGQGEPFTFHWKQDANGRWVEGPQRDKQLPRIPSLPLNARNAAAILKQLGGPEAPEGLAGRPAAHVSHRSRPGHARHGRAERRTRRDASQRHRRDPRAAKNPTSW